ncbi:MAG: PDZ domain-containing protein, partial [bacterium]
MTLACLAVACTETSAPPRTLTPRELGNVTAFANALGYIRFFHPTDAAVRVNWDAFAVRGIRAVQGATSDDSLALALASVFAPITSNVRFASSGASLPTTIPKPAAATHVVFWRHLGVGWPSGRDSPMLNLYHSERVVAPLRDIGGPVTLPPDSVGVTVSLPPVPDPAHPMIAALGGGVTMSMPVALYMHADFVEEGLREPSPSMAMERFEPSDRATRLADVALAWSLFQHFYPYFDVVHTDWPAALDAALRSAATDVDGTAFHSTLRRLTAALHDGHGYVNRESVPFQKHDVVFTRVEGRVLVSATGDSAVASGLRVGDEVLAVDDVPVQAKLDELSTMAAGATPQFVRWLALSRLLDGD